MKLGIDFGTCFSYMVAMKGEKAISLIVGDEEDEKQGIPTVFFRNSEGKELFGREAYSMKGRNPNNIITHIKRRIKADPQQFSLENDQKPEDQYPLGGKLFTACEIVEKILRYLIERAKDGSKKLEESGLSEEVEELCIAAPAAIGEQYKKTMKKIGMKITGLPATKVHIILEPIAAAVNYLFAAKEFDKKQTILTYDLGGGTLDVAVVEYDPSAEVPYQAVVTSGNTSLGGLDWDASLRALVQQKLGHGDPKDLGETFTVEQAISDAKIDLSKKERTFVSYALQGKMYDVAITRQEFEKATELLLKRTISCVEDVLAAYAKKKNVSVDEAIKLINKVVLVGGSSQMPQIQSGLISEFPQFRSNIVLHKPEKAIALGAAIYLQLQDKVQFIVPKNYGIAAIKTENGKEELLVFNLLGRNTPIKGDSIKREYVFAPREGGSSSYDFSIYESDTFTKTTKMEEREVTLTELQDAQIIKDVSFKMSYAPEVGKDTFPTTLQLDKDGVLHLYAEVKRGKKTMEKLDVTVNDVFTK